MASQVESIKRIPGLPRTFPSTIFCSDITADLLIHDYRLKVAGPGACQLVRLPMCERLVVDGVGVTALPANHCPGAVMLLFEVPRRGAAAAGGGGGGVHVILHTGDCR
ncbi:hypothetical protein MNEG_10624 [Monoraphidium neglectum]|uniref:Uncharacterized protein n=1 Tax=Monoraphidium neglectum TaxID=145388 RepID=A0A0D2M891_9CHLO|nr:hypothetical protein MNEG_10624 [Monoraphidium neglectum]KIY97341.1 hypothetical protein MNEG_10624 [Monoraphidium neglectum]|eukprot:XP_013896361.1 hypothetical protein MNEG_10624 [Monoraphidium neglectum]